MAVTFTSAGTYNASTSESQLTVVTTTSFAVGDFVVALLAYDNTGGGGADPMSGTLSCAPQGGGAVGAAVSAQTGINDPGAASAGIAARCVAWPVTAAIASGASLIISWTPAVAVKAFTLAKVSSAGITGYRTNSGNVGTNSVNLANATAFVTPSVNGPAGAVSEGVLCWTCEENGVAIGGDTDTLNGSWGTIFGTFTGTGVAGLAAYFQGKAVTANGAQTWNPTGNATLSDWISGCLIFTEGTVPAVTQASYGFYADGTESGAVALAAQDTAPSVELGNGDVDLQVRVRLQRTDTATSLASEYQLQYEKNASGTWNDVALQAHELVEGYTEDPTSAASFGNGTNNATGQSFKGTGRTLSRIGFPMYKSGSPSANLTAALFAHTGTFGSGGAPTGAALATSAASIAAAGLGTNANGVRWQYWDFSAGPTLVNATNYFAAVQADAGDASNYVAAGVGASNPGKHAGNRSIRSNAGAWSSINNDDQDFRVFASRTLPLTVAVASETSSLVEDISTTNRLGAGTGSFYSGRGSRTGVVGPVPIPQNTYTEYVWSIRLLAADFASGDTLRFRVVRNAVAPVLTRSTFNMTYSSVPTINIAKTAAAITQASYRWYDDGSQSGSSPLAAQDTPASGDVSVADGIGHLRVRLQSTNIVAPAALDDWQLQYEKNASGSWVNVAFADSLTVGLDSSFLETTVLINGPGVPFIYGQTFIGNGGKLTGASFYMRKVGNPAGTTIQARLSDHSGTFGAGGKPSLSSGSNGLAQSNTLDASVASTSFGWVRFTFDGSFTLVDGTAYTIVLQWAPGTATDYLELGTNTTSPTAAPGNAVSASGGAFTAQTYDMLFEVYTLGAAMLASNPVANWTGGTAIELDTANTFRAAQSFTAPSASKLGMVRFWGMNVGGTASSYVAKLYAHSGTFGSTGLPTGAALATSETVAPSKLPTSRGWVTFVFDGSFTLVSGTNYFISVEALSSPDPGALNLALENTTPPDSPGNAATYGFSSIWTTIGPGYDFIYELYSFVPTVAAYKSAFVTDGGATTSRLGAGSGSFVAGEVSETGVVSDLGWSANNYTELLYSLDVNNALVYGGDTLKFRVLRNGATTGMTYTAVPQLNVTAPSGSSPQSVAAQIATASFTALPGGQTLGGVSVAAQIATATFTAVPGAGSVAGGSPQSVAAQIATATFTSVPGVVAAGPVSVAAQIATASFTAVAGGKTTGGVSVAAQIATATFTGVPGVGAVAPALTVAAQIATATFTAVAGGKTTGPVSVAAQIATATFTAVAGGKTPGPVSVAAQIATATFAGVPGTAAVAPPLTVAAQIATATFSGVAGTGAVAAPLTVAAQIATATFTAIAGTPTAGGAPPLTVAAQIATASFTALPGGKATGGVSVTAQIASATFTAVAGTPAPGGVSVAAQIASAAFTALPGGVTRAVNVAAQIATATFTGVPGQPSVAVPLTVTAQVATATFTAISGTPTPGPVSRAAQIATATFTAVPGVSASAFFQPAQIAQATFSASQGGKTLGGVSVVAQIATATFVAVPGGPSAGGPPPLTAFAQIATATFTALPGGTIVGPVSVAAQVATATFTAVPGVAAAAPPLTVAAQIATATFSALPGGKTTGPVSVAAQIATATFTMVPGGKATGPVSVAAQIATATFTAVPGGPSAGGAPPLSVTAQIATATFSALPGGRVVGGATVAAQIATATFLVVPGVPTPGGVSRAAQIATATLSTVPGVPLAAFSQPAQVATATFSTVSGIPVPGGVSVPAQVAEATFTALSGTPRPGGVLVPAQSASATFEAVPGGTATTVSVAAQVAFAIFTVNAGVALLDVVKKLSIRIPPTVAAGGTENAWVVPSNRTRAVASGSVSVSGVRPAGIRVTVRPRP